MKRILICFTFLLIVLSACSKGEKETHYYLSLSGESDHWKLDNYEIMITPENSKAGNGTLTMKGEDEHMADFFSYDVYAIVDGSENRFHAGSKSGETDIAEQTTGTIEGDGEKFTTFSDVDEIYMTISWNEHVTNSDQQENGDREEKIVLYNKDEAYKTFLESE